MLVAPTIPVTVVHLAGKQSHSLFATHGLHGCPSNNSRDCVRLHVIHIVIGILPGEVVYEVLVGERFANPHLTADLLELVVVNQEPRFEQELQGTIII